MTTTKIITLRPRRTCDDSPRQEPIPPAEKIAEIAATRSLYQRRVSPAEIIDLASHQASPSE